MEHRQDSEGAKRQQDKAANLRLPVLDYPHADDPSQHSKKNPPKQEWFEEVVEKFRVSQLGEEGLEFV